MKPITFNKHFIPTASSQGHLRLVKYLHSVGCRSTKLAMDLASANGHIKVVKWLCENRREGCSPEALRRAAQNGHLEVVEFLVLVKGEKIRYFRVLTLGIGKSLL